MKQKTFNEALEDLENLVLTHFEFNAAGRIEWGRLKIQLLEARERELSGTGR